MSRILNYTWELVQFVGLWALLGWLAGFLVGGFVSFYYFEPVIWEYARTGLGAGTFFALCFWFVCDLYYIYRLLRLKS